MATRAQKLSVMLAFIAAALSLGSAAVTYAGTGQLRLTPVAGGIVMLVLGISGYKRITAPPA